MYQSFLDPQFGLRVGEFRSISRYSMGLGLAFEFQREDFIQLLHCLSESYWIQILLIKKDML